ncbi:DUF333 domain-containing protein [Methanoculleus sp. Wushi-C6]|uniref:DUF333 domain-containing protein n=1 Tax=Methanoculleus caldifontis TaxID=2651577 RepID=A0ABU3X106_9EURY|nr:DUF333 domain-containing protein [Methanoculleus sp. Wushi-C6]MDV2481116.1 DUF333 domain-containing protein [Methanoculleus sp. Wushi-C6]
MTRAYPGYPVILLTLLGAVIACGCMAAGGEDLPADRISGNGTVTYVDLEGGFYGIVGEGGRYLPVNLPEEFRQDGLRVRFVADPLKDTATLQQWGTPVEIVEIETADTRRTVAANGTITYVDLEGGFYGIVDDEGRRFLPQDLPEEYRVDGIRVAFSADVLDGGAGIHMWGTPVTLSSIERIDGVLLVSGNGTITYVDLEGGFYGLLADDGRRYLPLDLNETWQVDGVNVTFVGRVLEDVATIQQWGVPVEVLAIDSAGNTTYVAETGTVTYVDLEGGFYGIVTDGGERFLPLNLNETWRVDGMRIAFAGKIARDVATIQQWGTPVEIIAVPWSCATCGVSAGIADPAAVWCIEQGYAYETRKNPDGSEYGVCILTNGTAVDAWDLYRQNH